jgi:probable HAF family extracellular repeat protein
LELENSLDREGAISGYRLHEFPDMGSGHARASAINSIGVVVGQSNRTQHGPLHACLWRAEGTPVEIVPGVLASSAVDVNDGSEIAGTLHLRDGATRAFLMTPAGVRVSETLGGFHSNAHALNNGGEVVGGSWSIPGNTPGDKRERAFKWLPGEGLQDLGALGDDWCSRAADINDNGTVVGFSFPRVLFAGSNKAFVWTSSFGMEDLGSLDGSSAVAIAVNNRDEVIGLTSYQRQTVSFIWTRDGGMRALPLPEKSCVRGINDVGVIVYTRETTQGSRTFLWRNEQEISLPCYRGHQSEASDITNGGDLVGHVWRGNHGHAVKWSPI